MTREQTAYSPRMIEPEPYLPLAGGIDFATIARQCRLCGVDFYTVRIAKQYCSTEHAREAQRKRRRDYMREKYHERAKIEGKVNGKVV